MSRVKDEKERQCSLDEEEFKRTAAAIKISPSAKLCQETNTLPSTLSRQAE